MNHRRTIRWINNQDRDLLMRALTSHAALAAGELAVHADRIYVRASFADEMLHQEPFSHGTLLAHETEVFLLEAQTPVAHQRLCVEFQAGGALASLTDIAIFEQQFIVEVNGNPTLFFAWVDELTGPTHVKRRALLELHDTTLLQIAAQTWNSPELDVGRILEVAAGGDAW